MTKKIEWTVGEFDERLGYDCMTAGIKAGPVYLDGREYGQERNQEMDEEAKREMISDAHVIAASRDLLEALECEAALDMPNDHGMAVLEKHGWDRQDRFDLPATEFVRRMRVAALNKAKGGQ